MNDLTTEEIDILLSECEQEIKDALTRLANIMIERDALRRKIRVWREEMDVLELVKSGNDFSRSLVDINPITMHTLQKRYNDVVGKYNDKFAGKNKLKVHVTKSGIQELLENKVRKSSRKISQIATVQKLSSQEEKDVRELIETLFADYDNGTSIVRIGQKYNIDEEQVSNFVSIPSRVLAHCQETERWIVEKNSSPEDILLYIYKEACKDLNDLCKKCGITAIDLIDCINVLTNLISNSCK